MRRAAKVDGNHADIVAALRQTGATVLDLSAVGHGCPDLLVGRGGVNYLVEIKDGHKPPSKRKLTEQQVIFVNNWRGRVTVVENVDAALQATGAIK